MRFVIEHALFGAAAAFAFLAPDFFNTRSLRVDVAFLERFDFIEEEAAGEEPVESLMACGLAFHLETRGAVDQHHARGAFINVLATVSARANEGLVNVPLAYAERGHALRKLALFIRADGERAHAASVTVASKKGNGEGWIFCIE